LRRAQVSLRFEFSRAKGGTIGAILLGPDRAGRPTVELPAVGPASKLLWVSESRRSERGGHSWRSVKGAALLRKTGKGSAGPRAVKASVRDQHPKTGCATKNESKADDGGKHGAEQKNKEGDGPAWAGDLRGQEGHRRGISLPTAGADEAGGLAARVAGGRLRVRGSHGGPGVTFGAVNKRGGQATPRRRGQTGMSFSMSIGSRKNDLEGPRFLENIMDGGHGGPSPVQPICPWSDGSSLEDCGAPGGVAQNGGGMSWQRALGERGPPLIRTGSPQRLVRDSGPGPARPSIRRWAGGRSLQQEA